MEYRSRAAEITMLDGRAGGGDEMGDAGGMAAVVIWTTIFRFEATDEERVVTGPAAGAVR
jgi:hypothetical protein